MKIKISKSKRLDIDFDYDFNVWFFPLAIMYDRAYETLAIAILCFSVEFEIMNKY